MKFSVIVVCLNPGEKLRSTMYTILDQTYQDYEVILKDGGSTDGSVEDCIHSMADFYGEAVTERIHLYDEADKGIYDAMNQAISHASGDYLIFMNCGDYFYDSGVLERIAAVIAQAKEEAVLAGSPLSSEKLHIVYGDRCQSMTGSIEYSPRQIDAFTCYRNIPCHQTCFYSKSCFAERQYHLMYKVRADYEHFLWCHFKKQAVFTCFDGPVAKYEGGGYSDVQAEVSAKEHREITKLYMTAGQRIKYKAFLVLTLQPLRHAIASNPKLADTYNNLVRMLRKKG